MDHDEQIVFIEGIDNSFYNSRAMCCWEAGTSSKKPVTSTWEINLDSKIDFGDTRSF